jgi:hypothetical protein
MWKPKLKNRRHISFWNFGKIPWETVSQRCRHNAISGVVKMYRVFFKLHLAVGVKESTVNAPFV